MQESVSALSIKPSGVYVDATFGGGGHSQEIVRRLDAGGRLFGFDQDSDAMNNLRTSASDRTVILTTHRPSVQALCNRVYRVDDAKVCVERTED